MLKRIFVYFVIGGISVILLVLGLIASGVLLKKPAKPLVTTLPEVAVEAPSVVGEEKAVEAKAPVASDELLPKTEEQVSVPLSTEAQVSPTEKEVPLKYEFQKGMSYVAWTADGYSNANSAGAIAQMGSLGVTWVGVMPTWYQDHHNSTEVYPQMDKSPTDDSLIFAIHKLHESGFKVMIKPHLDLISGDGKWRGEIGFDNPADWQTWFESYATFILHYAGIAAKENVELFCIGTELTNATITQPERWRELIKKVREIYKGPLTYAANWSKEFDQIAFWDALDYAGIDPYFPLVTSSRPQVEELKSAWLDWMKVIEEWQQKINKPVILTEIGYKSSRDASDEPWQHNAIGELDLEIQVNLYRALLESFWDKPWFYGLYWWHWGVNPRMGGELSRGFTPQNKPAQEVIKEWYGKPVPQKAY